MTGQPDVPPALLDRLREICRSLAEATEEQAWVGTRWSVRTRTFAHVLRIEAGWPPAYARAAGTNGPADVLMFRSAGPELHAMQSVGPPFFATPWRADEVGVCLDVDTDWDEIAELLTESHSIRAPRTMRPTT